MSEQTRLEVGTPETFLKLFEVAINQLGVDNFVDSPEFYDSVIEKAVEYQERISNPGSVTLFKVGYATSYPDEKWKHMRIQKVLYDFETVQNIRVGNITSIVESDEFHADLGNYKWMHKVDIHKWGGGHS